MLCQMVKNFFLEFSIYFYVNIRPYSVAQLESTLSGNTFTEVLHPWPIAFEEDFQRCVYKFYVKKNRPSLWPHPPPGIMKFCASTEVSDFLAE